METSRSTTAGRRAPEPAESFRPPPSDMMLVCASSTTITGRGTSPKPRADWRGQASRGIPRVMVGHRSTPVRPSGLLGCSGHLGSKLRKGMASTLAASHTPCREARAAGGGSMNMARMATCPRRQERAKRGQATAAEWGSRCASSTASNSSTPPHLHRCRCKLRLSGFGHQGATPEASWLAWLAGEDREGLLSGPPAAAFLVGLQGPQPAINVLMSADGRGRHPKTFRRRPAVRFLASLN